MRGALAFCGIVSLLTIPFSFILGMIAMVAGYFPWKRGSLVPKLAARAVGLLLIMQPLVAFGLAVELGSLFVNYRRNRAETYEGPLGDGITTGIALTVCVSWLAVLWVGRATQVKNPDDYKAGDGRGKGAEAQG